MTGAAGLAAVAILAATAAIPAAIGPDASMYAAVATSLLRHAALSLPDGSLVVDRPPLFAVTVAMLGATGLDVGAAAIIVSKIGFAALLGAIGWLGYRLGGGTASALALVAVGWSPVFLRWSSATLVDGLQAALAVLAIVALTGARTRRRWALFGALLGLAFLTKETALYLLVVPLCVAIVDRPHTLTRVRWTATAWLAFGVVALPWIAWVAAQTGRLYLVGVPMALAGPALTVVAVVLLVVAGWDGITARSWGDPSRRVRWAVALTLLACWVVAGWLALERTADMPATTSVIRATYRYLRLTLLPELPLLLPAVLGATAGAAWSIRRPDLRPSAFALVAASPVALFVASTGFEARSIATLIGLSAVLAGVAGVAALSWLLQRLPEHEPSGRQGAARQVTVSVTLLIALLWATPSAVSELRATPARVMAATWDRPLVSDLAHWLTGHTTAGETVLASWQYAAMLYVRSDGRYLVRQVPLVRTVETPGSSRPLDEIRTMDSWQDRPLDGAPAGPIVYASAFPKEGTIVVLEERRLLDAIRASDARLLVTVSAGPLYRSGGNYPDLAASLGVSAPGQEFADAQGWARIDTLPFSPTLAYHPLTLSPAVATWIVSSGPAVALERLNALGPGPIRIWPPTDLDPSVVSTLEGAGRTVTMGSPDGAR